MPASRGPRGPRSWASPLQRLLIVLTSFAALASLAGWAATTPAQASSAPLAASAARKPSRKQWNRLYAWVGNPSVGDHLAVVDFDPASATYGTVIQRAFLSSNDSAILTKGNEAHHLGVTSDGRWIVAGGLGSFLSGKRGIFAFQVQADGTITYARSIASPGLGCVDAFLPYSTPSSKPRKSKFSRFGKKTKKPTPAPSGSFLVTMMCNAQGGAPGALVVVDPTASEVKPWSSFSSSDDVSGFNPHGADYDPKLGAVSADYILPTSLFGKSAAGLVFHDTIRFFSPKGQLARTVQMPTKNSGYMDIRRIPGDRKGRAITMALATRTVYLVDPTTGNATALYRIPFGSGSFSAGIIAVSSDATRFMFSFQMRYLLLFSLSYDKATDSYAAGLLDTFDFCSPPPEYAAALASVTAVCGNLATYPAKLSNYPGTHYISYDEDTERLVVVNYFIQVGLAQFPGSHTMHAFSLTNNRNSLALDTAFAPVFDLNGKTSFPHAMAFSTGVEV